MRSCSRLQSLTSSPEHGEDRSVELRFEGERAEHGAASQEKERVEVARHRAVRFENQRKSGANVAAEPQARARAQRERVKRSELAVAGAVRRELPIAGRSPFCFVRA